MRNRFDRQLVQLNNELIEMGGMIEKAISDTVKALVNQDIELASNVIEYDEEIDHQEREIEPTFLTGINGATNTAIMPTATTIAATIDTTFKTLLLPLLAFPIKILLFIDDINIS